MAVAAEKIPVFTIATETSASDDAGGILRQFLDGWRRARADRAARDAFAELDGATLRDIGLDADEVARAQVAENFMPRAWAA